MELTLTQQNREVMVEAINDQPLRFIFARSSRVGKETYSNVLKRCFRDQFSVQTAMGAMRDLDVWSRKSPRITNTGVVRFNFLCRNCDNAIHLTTNATIFRSEGVVNFPFTHHGCEVTRKQLGKYMHVAYENILIDFLFHRRYQRSS